MGAGNVCTFGEYEGLFYLDQNFISTYSKVNRCSCGSVLGSVTNDESKTARELSKAGIAYDFDGRSADWAYDEFLSGNEWTSMIELMQESLMSRFKSFSKCDRWRGVTAYDRSQNRHVVLENGMFEIAVVDNEWSAAWMLLERADIEELEYRNGVNLRPLMARHYHSYLYAIRDILLDTYGECSAYSGAWTSSRITREDVAV